jgi:hypothetical protein
LRAITNDFRVVQFRDVSRFVSGQPPSAWEILLTMDIPDKAAGFPLLGVSQTITSPVKYTLPQATNIFTTNADFQQISAVPRQEVLLATGFFGTGDDCGFQRSTTFII